MQSKHRKSCFKFQCFGIAKEVLPLVAFGLVLATVDVYSDLALSYQFFSVETTSLITKARYQGVLPEDGEFLKKQQCKKGTRVQIQLFFS